MTKQVKIGEPTAKHIRTSDPAVRRLDPKAVADALGGESCGEHIEGQPGPVSLYALRQELLRRRQSSGGRPGIEGTNFRAKIPVGDQDWQRLEALAASLSANGFAPSAGQVASILLSIALQSVNTDVKVEAQDQPDVLARDLASRLRSVR